MRRQRSLKIAQVAPLFESVPPQRYGGTERVVANLTEELVRRGHDVTLFASGDSCTSARLYSSCGRSLRSDSSCIDPMAPHYLLFEKLRRHSSNFDVIHFHTETMHLNASRNLQAPFVTTMHGRLDLPEYVPLYREFNDAELISISLAQRKPLSFARWIGNVYHGLPADLIRYRTGGGGYLAFLGRISKEKRVDRAIEIARRTGHRLVIAAKIDPADREYAKTLAPLLQQSFVEFVGEIGDRDKTEFLGNAKALLFPIDWPEPFGLVMIESLAAGTPVIAYPQGSVPEIINDGATGFWTHDIDEACAAVKRLGEIDRERCRSEFESRFTIEKMVDRYEEIYRQILTRANGATEPTFGGLSCRK
jgi:glycosyltransferase involved in cell wall biosynthesis